MTVLLDNLSSIIVFSTVALVLAVTQFRMQADTVEATVAYMAKKQLLSFAEVIEDEFELMGEGVSGDKIESITSDGYGRTSSFVFNREIDGAETEVEYQLVAVDTVDVSGRDVEVFRVDRLEDGSPAGGGPGLISDFRVELLTSTGSAATTSTARVVRISMSVLHAVGDVGRHKVNTSYWGMTLRPASLDI